MVFFIVFKIQFDGVWIEWRFNDDLAGIEGEFIGIYVDAMGFNGIKWEG